ncbi:MAG TPA: FapA family protein [Geobacteraceae bacterium]
MGMGESVGGAAGKSPESGIAGKEFKKLGYSLFVCIPDNKLECRCSYVPRAQGAMITRDELRGYLGQCGVKEGIDEEAVEDFAIKAGAGKELSSVLLAFGVAPVAGADGRIAYSVQPSTIIQDETDDGATMDMHQVQTFLNVLPGDEIARLIPPEPGSAGRSITGQTIPAQPGKDLKLKIGRNIRCEEDGSLLFADAAGRVCIASGEISVEEEYVISGDVDFRVGSIVFNGFVEVRGDVLNDFNVTSTKGIRISGNIGACAIQSDGDISFCGMDGQERGTIVCNGTIRANFLHDCSVTCAGDVIVDVELHNCMIKTLGRIFVNKGAISGGSYTALGGIEARKIGSPASVRTKLTVGMDYRDTEELERLFAELERNQAQIGMTQSLQEIGELRKARGELTDRVFAIRTKVVPQANPKVNVKTMLYDNVLMSLGTINEEIREQKDGPISIIENTVEGGLRYLLMTSLDVKATDMELAYAREQKR